MASNGHRRMPHTSRAVSLSVLSARAAGAMAMTKNMTSPKPTAPTVRASASNRTLRKPRVSFSS